jgi:hypothetical protein
LSDELVGVEKADIILYLFFNQPPPLESCEILIGHLFQFDKALYLAPLADNVEELLRLSNHLGCQQGFQVFSVFLAILIQTSPFYYNCGVFATCCRGFFVILVKLFDVVFEILFYSMHGFLLKTVNFELGYLLFEHPLHQQILLK